MQRGVGFGHLVASRFDNIIAQATLGLKDRGLYVEQDFNSKGTLWGFCNDFVWMRIESPARSAGYALPKGQVESCPRPGKRRIRLGSRKSSDPI